jgi:hypothetical protein
MDIKVEGITLDIMKQVGGRVAKCAGFALVLTNSV